MSTKYEAKPLNKAKGADDFHRVMIHRDANKNPSGVDMVAERKDAGYEMDEEKSSYVIMKKPKAEYDADHKRESRRFADLDSRLSGDPDAIEDRVTTGSGVLNDD